MNTATRRSDREKGNRMKRKQTEQVPSQILQEYRNAIRAARTALDELEKEVEEELGPGSKQGETTADGEKHEEG